MASGKRGKIKEHLEGVHRNCEWITDHCVQSMQINNDVHPELTESFQALAEIALQLDHFANNLYSQF